MIFPEFDRLEFRLEFRPYCRPFKQPLQTHHGVWRDRQGILLRVTTATGQVQWGEIAPIEFFGTESLERAIDFCQSLSDQVTACDIQQIPPELPACRFGFGMLWAGGEIQEKLRCSWLLPSGRDAIAALHQMAVEDRATFKWKIGVAGSVAEELAVFDELVRVMPKRSKLRLDANAGLDWQGACQWLECCDRYRAEGIEIEFLEQPLPPMQLAEMVELGDRFSTPLALDESVATIDQLQRCADQGWRGIFVVKAAIAGDPVRLLDLIRSRQLDVVWSSAFETAIARRFIEQRLMLAVPSTLKRAIGFGVGQWFADGWDGMEFEELWRVIG